jgi:hypothetical protein
MTVEKDMGTQSVKMAFHGQNAGRRESGLKKRFSSFIIADKNSVLSRVYPHPPPKRNNKTPAGSYGGVSLIFSDIFMESGLSVSAVLLSEERAFRLRFLNRRRGLPRESRRSRLRRNAKTLSSRRKETRRGFPKALKSACLPSLFSRLYLRRNSATGS